MAEIRAGTVTVGAGRYEVILRPLGGNSNPPVPEDSSTGVPAQNAKNSGAAGGGKKAKKATNQEGGKKTRKLSSYMKFAQEVRPNLMKEHPELKSDIPGTGRKIGEMWRGLSDAEKARY